MVAGGARELRVARRRVDRPAQRVGLVRVFDQVRDAVVDDLEDTRLAPLRNVAGLRRQRALHAAPAGLFVGIDAVIGPVRLAQDVTDLLAPFASFSSRSRLRMFESSTFSPLAMRSIAARRSCALTSPASLSSSCASREPSSRCPSDLDLHRRQRRRAHLRGPSFQYLAELVSLQAAQRFEHRRPRRQKEYPPLPSRTQRRCQAARLVTARS